MLKPHKVHYFKRVISSLVMTCFFVTSLNIPFVHAQEFFLPKPGVMVHLSPFFYPPVLKGIKVHPDNPFRFDFILDKGDGYLTDDQLKEESTKLIKYFLASLTVPEKDLWVNLSPYEKDRIIPQSFGLTEMGRDLLAQDYMLKQITASLIYPEDEIGKKFWKRIYEEAARKFGTTNIPVNTFNKVWIVPEKAIVYENANAGTAYVVESKLKVMLEEDYLALSHSDTKETKASDTNRLGSQIVREIVIPELTKEVNEGKNFVQLRQVYQSLILATWYKKKIKDSILAQAYTDKNKVAGVSIDDPQEKQRIYEQYLRAFKKGVYNYIKEEQDPITQQVIPRKYFSGGETFLGLGDMAQIIDDHTVDSAMRSRLTSSMQNLSLILVAASLTIFSSASNTLAAQSLPKEGSSLSRVNIEWGDLTPDFVSRHATEFGKITNDQMKQSIALSKTKQLFAGEVQKYLKSSGLIPSDAPAIRILFLKGLSRKESLGNAHSSFALAINESKVIIVSADAYEGLSDKEAFALLAVQSSHEWRHVRNFYSASNMTPLEDETYAYEATSGSMHRLMEDGKATYPDDQMKAQDNVTKAFRLLVTHRLDFENFDRHYYDNIEISPDGDTVKIYLFDQKTGAKTRAEVDIKSEAVNFQKGVSDKAMTIEEIKVFYDENLFNSFGSWEELSGEIRDEFVKISQTPEDYFTQRDVLIALGKLKGLVMSEGKPSLDKLRKIAKDILSVSSSRTISLRFHIRRASGEIHHQALNALVRLSDSLTSDQLNSYWDKIIEICGRPNIRVAVVLNGLSNLHEMITSEDSLMKIVDDLIDIIQISQQSVSKPKPRQYSQSVVVRDRWGIERTEQQVRRDDGFMTYIQSIESANDQVIEKMEELKESFGSTGLTKIWGEIIEIIKSMKKETTEESSLSDFGYTSHNEVIVFLDVLLQLRSKFVVDSYWKGIFDILKAKGVQQVQNFYVALMELKSKFEDEEFEKHWDDVVKICLTLPSEEVNPVLHSLAVLKEKFTAGETVEEANKYWEGVLEITKAAGSKAKDVLQTLTILSGDYSKIQTAFERRMDIVSENMGAPIQRRSFINGQDDLRKYGKDILTIVNLTNGAESRNLDSINQLVPLMSDFPSFWNQFIKPVVYRQTVGSFLIFNQVKILYQQKAIQSQEDIDFLLRFINKNGVKASDTLQNFIVPGIQQKVIASPLSQESKALELYFDQGGYPIIEIYRTYKNDPGKYQELIERCRNIHQALIDGNAKAYENDSLFAPMQMYVFPPEVTASRDMYGQITSQRPDRPQDTDIIPLELRKTEPMDVSTGDYNLKDVSRPLDATPWSIILDVVKDENSKSEHKMSEEENLTLGNDLLTQWQGGALGKYKRELLGRLYRFHLAQGGPVLPQDLNTVRNIMTLKEFAGDTLRDVVFSVLKKNQDLNPSEYENALKRMFKTKLENPKGVAGNVVRVLQKFHDSPEEGKVALGKIIKVTDADVIDQLWQRLSDLSNPKEVENVLTELEFKIQPGKEADIIARQLLGEEMAKMQGEFSAKYEFNEQGQKISLRFEASKRRAHGVAGLNMGVCVVPDTQLWNNPNFMNVLIWNEDNIALGGMHLLIIEDNGRKYLTLPGINPSTSLLTKVNADDIYNKLIAYALKLNKALGYDGVVIPTAQGIHSNRPEVQRVIASRQYKTMTLSTTHQFSHSPHPYSFNTVFVVDKAQIAIGKPTQIDNLTRGGIDFTADKTPLEIKNTGEDIKFNIDPAMLQQLQNAPGFVPVIINFQPLQDLPTFLGVSFASKEPSELALK